MSKYRVTKKILIDQLETTRAGIKELNDFIYDVKRALGLGSYESNEKVLEKVEKVLEKVEKIVEENMQSDIKNQVMRGEQRGHQKGVESMYERENKMLWHLLRSLMGDKTLEKEMLRVQDNGLGHVREIVVTPFTENQSYL